MFIAWNCLYPTDTSCTRLTPPHVFYIINGLRFWVIIVGAAPSECIQPTWPSFSVHVSVYLTLLYFLLVPVWFLGPSHAGGGTLWTRCIQPLEHCYMSHQYILVNCTVLWGHREAGSGSEVSIPTPPHSNPHTCPILSSKALFWNVLLPPTLWKKVIGQRNTSRVKTIMPLRRARRSFICDRDHYCSSYDIKMPAVYEGSQIAAGQP